MNEVTSHVSGGINYTHLKLTAGGADSSVTYTFPDKPTILGVTLPVKTTGSAGAVNLTYVLSTGVLTATCSANDVVRITVLT